MSQGFAPITSSWPCATTKKLKGSIMEEFIGLDDPRTKRQPQHLLIDILTITILAVISGSDSMVAIETYGKRKQKWLETFLELPYGIPSHETFSRVLAQIDPQQMRECFLSWVSHLSRKLAINLISIDGKTSRGSYDRNQGITALHTITAWASEHHLVLAQQAVEQKSNEITAIPELLQLLDLTGAIITIDAMGAQKKIAAQIVSQGGDYVLMLKGNQDNLYKDVKAFFKQAQAFDWQGIDYSYTETTEAGHHPIEHRQVWAVGLGSVHQPMSSGFGVPNSGKVSRQ
ncbi:MULTISPECIES: ISAs1 family transposase [Moorena]|uniref:Transposase n=1 Tax=Moorena producens 3L TaxID=489825 RepID=F4XM15_9CYAN|nr:ISAs1 family transposase [Moorena producens]EGJ34364.1 transposase [Moorena producens 3L]